jgi:hypothetical protein
MDRDQHPGGVTGTPFEDDTDIECFDGRADKGEAWAYPRKREEPARDADLARGGTSWNANLPIRSFVGLGPRNWRPSDKKLKERVCEVLTRSHEVDPTEMNVKVKDGVAYLSGTIKSRGMKRVAEDLVGSIPGIIDVFTNLQIKSSSNLQQGL